MVEEKLVAEAEEALLEIHAVKCGRGRAIEGQFAQLLAEAAARVEDGVAIIDQAGENAFVEGMSAEVQVEEAQLADAGIRE